jgi:hypothetical protein
MENAYLGKIDDARQRQDVIAFLNRTMRRFPRCRGMVPGSKGDAMWAGAWCMSYWIDLKEQLVGNPEA